MTIRAPFNVLVLPFSRSPEAEPLFCVLHRSDADWWQFVAGGGEDHETPLEAARRETQEEIGTTGQFFDLSMTARIPKVSFIAHVSWPEDLYVIPEHMYAVEVPSQNVVLSREHSAFRWLPYQDAFDLLHWQSNQSALWELSERLQRCDLIEATDGML